MLYSINTDEQTCRVNDIELSPNIKEYHFVRATKDDEIKVEISLPMKDIAYQWYPGKQLDDTIKPDWGSTATINLQYNAPICTLIGYKNENQLTFAADAIYSPLQLDVGVHEEDGTLRITVRTTLEALNIRIDTRHCPFYQSINDISTWWDASLNSFPSLTEQREPLFSTWYAFHQDVSETNIKLQLPKLKNLGIKRIILDDGWQTDDGNRGYAFTGDWEVSQRKFPDFKEFVKNMHEEGIQTVVWFSVPFIGQHSKRWNLVKDKLLFVDERIGAGILDLRYQSNVDFLLDVFRQFIETYQIDGLKLDFIDSFKEYPQMQLYDPTHMEYETIELGLRVFLDRLKNIVQNFSPTFFIEFRQSYIGPAMRAYSNAFRVADCPYAPLSNHVGICDLRLLSSTTPVHSDMVMWHPTETPEVVALQLQSTLFSVTQISVDLNIQSKSQLIAIKYFLQFSRKYISELQSGSFHLFKPEANYPVVEGIDKAADRRIIQCYGMTSKITINNNDTVIVNTSFDDSIDINLETFKKYEFDISDCMGKTQKKMQIRNQNYLTIPQYIGGYTSIRIM